MVDVNEFSEEERLDVIFPPFVVCPTYFDGSPSNITAISCQINFNGAVTSLLHFFFFFSWIFAMASRWPHTFFFTFFFVHTYQASPITTISRATFPVFTPRFGQRFWDTCQSVTVDQIVKDVDFYLDLVDCSIQTTGNVLVYVFPESGYGGVFFLSCPSSSCT